MTTVALSPLAALLTTVTLRFTPAEQPWAWPWPAGGATAEMALASATALVAALATAWRNMPDRAGRRSMLAATAWPALPVAAAWWLAPVFGRPGPAPIMAAVIVVSAGVLLHRRHAACGEPAQARPAQVHPARPAWRRRFWPGAHIAAVAVMAVVGVAGGGFADVRALALSLLLYPVYAFVQLFLCLAVPWPWLQDLAGGRRGPAIATVAVVFALVHWPNPGLMILTGGGMAFWALAWSRGRSLPALAISMGVLATLAAQGMPDRWTEHMRAGPRAVRQRAVPALAESAHAATADLPDGAPRTRAFIAELYPGIVGRPAESEEMERWWLSLQPALRAVQAWHMYRSDEYQRRLGDPAADPPLPGPVHWTRLPAPWPERIGAWSRRTDDGQVPDMAALYRGILRRPGSPAEHTGWPAGFSITQRQRMVEILLEHRRRLAAAPFDTMGCADLLIHH
jgi:hypothetical protein